MATTPHQFAQTRLQPMCLLKLINLNIKVQFKKYSPKKQHITTQQSSCHLNLKSIRKVQVKKYYCQSHVSQKLMKIYYQRVKITPNPNNKSSNLKENSHYCLLIKLQGRFYKIPIIEGIDTLCSSPCKDLHQAISIKPNNSQNYSLNSTRTIIKSLLIYSFQLRNSISRGFKRNALVKIQLVASKLPIHLSSNYQVHSKTQSH